MSASEEWFSDSLRKALGPSATAEIIRTFDWSTTPLGPIEQWPASLKTAAALVVRSPAAMVLMWGEDGVMLYNDAYAVIAGARHPAALGSRVRESWPEIAAFNGHVLEVVLKGQDLTYRDQPLSIERSGHPEQAWFTLDYSPVAGESGEPAGVIAIVVETTARVRAEAWLQSERERLRQMFNQAPGFMAMLRGPTHVFDLVNPAYLQLVGHRQVVGQTVREALPEIEGQGFFELLDKVFSSGEAFSGQGIPVSLRKTASSAPEQRFVDLVYQPVRDPSGQVLGIFVQGADVTDRISSQHAVQLSEARNRQILDSAIDYAIIAFDLDGKVTRWNEGAHRVLGWTEAEMLGRDASAIFTPEDRAAGRMEEEMKAALAAGAGDDERWHIRKSGERFWAAGEMTPILDAARVATGFVKVLRDRTDQHRAAQALRQSEASLRRAQQAGGVGTFSLALDTGLVSGTREFFLIYGLGDHGDVPVASMEALVLPEDGQFRRMASTRDPQLAPLAVEYRIRRASDGAIRWIARKAEWERDDSGRAVRMLGVVQDITERKADQRAVEESAAQFRTFAQALPNHVWTSPPDGLLDWFNERVYEYSGAVPGELDGAGWARIVHADDLAHASAKWAAALASGEPYETEFRLRRADGEFRWHLARGVPIRTADGVISRWVGTNTDIHERKLAEAESTRDRDRIWTLSQEMMLVCDHAGVIAAVNPAATRLLGWSADEMVGQRLTAFLHPDDVAASAAELDKVSHGAATLAFENRYRAKDGSYLWFDWTAVPDGGLIHGVARNITGERAAAEERERIWSSMNDLMATTNRHAGLRTTNPAWQRLLGYDEAELVSRPLLELVDADDRHKLLAAFDALARGETVAEFELRLLHKDQRRFLLAWTAQHVGDVLYLVGRNVTEQRSVEEALRQSQKMEAVGQLTGGIAHDFNNLLQGITGSLSLVQKRIAQGKISEIDGFINGAMASAKRAAALTHRLLAFSRRQPLDPRPVDPNPLISSMEDLLQRTLGERVSLQMKLAPDISLTKCDPHQLENAILNLAINSRDAMPDGGMLTIETANVTIADTLAARQDGMRPGSYVCVSVSDTGTGMSADTIAKAFEPFFTTKPLGQGTGLGLSMIYGFARQSDGHAKISSAIGLGTSVQLYLPSHRGTAEAEAPLPKLAAVPTAGSGEVVLVVEDESVVRALVVEVLGDLGYQVLQAVDGPAGLTMLQSDQRIDLLITDIGLPGLNGRQIADAGRLTRPGLRVLFMTGYAETAATASGFLEPGMAMITKPFAMDVLASKVRETISVPAPSPAGGRSQGDRAGDEASRQASLDALQILDSEHDQAYDDLTRRAADIFGVDIALISLVDRERQWFKSRVGLMATETPREFSFCAHAIREPKSVFLINDATQDPRFAGNPLVTGDPGIRFYAGAPLITSSGHAVGTICAIGKAPMVADAAQLEELRFLADQVMQTLEARRHARGAADQD